MEINLSGKRALVCGSSDGIGKAIALSLAKAGAEIILAARNPEKLGQVLNSLPGKNHRFIVADFTKVAETEEAVKKVLSQGKPVHILVNNTSGPPPGAILNESADKFLSYFSSHLIINQALSKLVVEGMMKEKYGRIINIASTSVREPIKGLGVSNTIRAAVAGWAKTLSTEVAASGITVNNILPGYTKTQRLTSLIEQRSVSSGKTTEEIEQEMLSEVPAGRFAEPEELAAIAVFLASPFAGYITGVSIQVDGGKMKSF